MYGYIYKTINLINNKIYIGQKHSQIFLGNKYLGSGLHLKQAIKKYGKQNFIVELLCFCATKAELDQAEKYYIKLYNSTNSTIGYNISLGGYGPEFGGFNGKHHTTATKEKIRQAAFMDNKKRRESGWVNPLIGQVGHIAANKGKILIIKNTVKKYIDKADFVYYEQDGWTIVAKNRSSSLKRPNHKLSEEEKIKLSIKMKKAMSKYKGKKRDPQIAAKVKATKLKNGTLSKKPANAGTKLMYNDFKQIWVPVDQIESYKALGYIVGRKFGNKTKLK